MTLEKSRLFNSKLHVLGLSMVGVLIALCIQVLLVGPRVAPSAEANSISVGLVTDVGTLDDMGFNWLSYQGLLRAEDELGVVGTVYTSTSSTDYETNLQQCVDDGNHLCISVGFLTADAISTTATANPATDFSIVDSSFESYPDNLRGMLFAADEVGYLAGTLAGLMTVSDTIGAVGAMEIQPVQDFVEPYRNGAQCANPDVDVLIEYTGSFSDTELGAQTAQDMIAEGADVIFGVGGPMGNAAVLTATQSGAWGIGVDFDTWVTLFKSGEIGGSDKLLSSAMKRMDNTVFATIADVVSDTFTSGTVIYDLEAGGVGLAPFHETEPFVPQSVRDALARVEKGIIWGIIDVNGPCPAYIYLPLTMKNYAP